MFKKALVYSVTFTAVQYAALAVAMKVLMSEKVLYAYTKKAMNVSQKAIEEMGENF